MALKHKMGLDLSSGTPRGVVTRVGKSNSDAEAVDITVEGPLSALEGSVPAKGATHGDYAFVPAGCYVQSARLSSDGRGGGMISIKCVAPGEDSQQTPAAPTKVTYRIEMAEEQTDLIAHPTIAASETTVSICLKWLATDDGNKLDSQGGYQYDEGDGETFTPVSDENAIKFCQAWMHGIKTYNRYFPVVEKISIYRRVPGLAMSGAKITSGTAEFSADIGKWDVPDIKLVGYNDTGFFKSKDSWVEQARSSWQRTEQWVWTPDGSASDYGWIYEESASSAGNGGGGLS